jgi:hypothetical protein
MSVIMGTSVLLALDELAAAEPDGVLEPLAEELIKALLPELVASVVRVLAVVWLLGAEVVPAPVVLALSLRVSTGLSPAE